MGYTGLEKLSLSYSLLHFQTNSLKIHLTLTESLEEIVHIVLLINTVEEISIPSPVTGPFFACIQHFRFRLTVLLMFVFPGDPESKR